MYLFGRKASAVHEEESDQRGSVRNVDSKMEKKTFVLSGPLMHVNNLREKPEQEIHYFAGAD